MEILACRCQGCSLRNVHCSSLSFLHVLKLHRPVVKEIHHWFSSNKTRTVFTFFYSARTNHTFTTVRNTIFTSTESSNIVLSSFPRPCFPFCTLFCEFLTSTSPFHISQVSTFNNFTSTKFPSYSSMMTNCIISPSHFDPSLLFPIFRLFLLIKDFFFIFPPFLKQNLPFHISKVWSFDIFIPLKISLQFMKGDKNDFPPP